MNKKGFTLIEILVVVAIVGILSGFIFYTVQNNVSKANIAKSQVFAESARNNLLINLTAEWKIDDGSGTSIADSWGTNTGTLTGGTWRSGSSCVAGSCVEFGGTSDHYILTGSDAGTVKTVSLWIYADDNTTRDIMIIRSTATAANLTLNASGVLTASGFTSPIIYVDGSSASAAVSQGAWHHIVATTTTGITSTALTIGKVTTNYFDGKIDDVSVFSGSLPASQIEEIYNAGLQSLIAKGAISE